MSRFPLRRPAVRLALLLPVLLAASCGGNNTGAIVTVPTRWWSQI